MSGFLVESVGAEAFQVVARLYSSAFDDPWPEPSVRELLGTPGTRALIAVDAKGQPAGFLLARIVLDEGEILSIGTHPAFRRAGAARALMTAFLDRARRAGAAAVFLEVGEDNPAAKALYSMLGFETTGRRKQYYRRADGQRVDALIMVKKFRDSE